MCLGVFLILEVGWRKYCCVLCRYKGSLYFFWLEFVGLVFWLDKRDRCVKVGEECLVC